MTTDYELTLAGPEAAAICAASSGSNGQGEMLLALAKSPLARREFDNYPRERNRRGRGASCAVDAMHLSRYDGTDYVQWLGRHASGHFRPFGAIMQIVEVAAP